MAASSGKVELSQLPLVDTLKSEKKLGEVLGHERVILIILDMHSDASRKLLSQLSQSGYQGEGAVVIMLSSTPSQLRDLQSQTNWPYAKWLSGDAALVLPSIGLRGTPTIVGIETQQRIGWRYSGSPKGNANALELRMLDWLLSNDKPKLNNATSKGAAL